MTLGKKFAVVIGVLVVAFSVLAAMEIAQRSRYIYPDANTRSSFIDSYHPEKLVDHFRCRDWSFATGDAGSSSAGQQFARHGRLWHSDVLLKPGDDVKMMASLRDDILLSVNGMGAHVTDIDQPQNTKSGFEFRYTVGNTNGRVTAYLSEPEWTKDATKLPIQTGENFVGLKVEIDERWFKSRQSADLDSWPRVR